MNTQYSSVSSHTLIPTLSLAGSSKKEKQQNKLPEAW